MGTNYYVRDQIGEQGRHVGKLSSSGYSGQEFRWAMTSAQFLRYVRAGAEFLDEYGCRNTPDEMLEVILVCNKHLFDSIGEEFS